MSVTKRDLARKIAEELGSSIPEAYRMVKVLFETMTEELIAGNRMELRGFGTLGTKVSAPRPFARNPRTGEATPVPARRRVYFRAGKRLKEGMSKEL